MADELITFLKYVAPEFLTAEGLTNSTKSVTGESLLDRKLMPLIPKMESAERILPPQGTPNSPIKSAKKDGMTP